MSVRVVNKLGSGKNETIGQNFLRCYDIDDIISAFDNMDVLVDVSKGGSGNQYFFTCTEPASSSSLGSERLTLSWVAITFAIVSLLATSS